MSQRNDSLALKLNVSNNYVRQKNNIIGFIMFSGAYLLIIFIGIFDIKQFDENSNYNGVVCGRFVLLFLNYQILSEPL